MARAAAPLLLLLALAAPTARWAWAADVAVPQVSEAPPPSFGHQLGDTVRRELHLQLPAGARFDAQSLPPPTRHGAALELASVQHQGADDASRQTVLLRYQIFRSPPAPAVLEMPALALRFTVPQGTARREQTVKVEALPLMVSPIAPDAPPNRAGLGPMQPDQPTPLLPLRPLRQRATAWAVLAVAALGGLAWRHGVQPWRQRRQRPFARAWQDIRRIGAPPLNDATLAAAMRRLHAALQDDAGHVVLATDLPAWLARRPRYADLADALQAFHARSERFFFSAHAPAPAPDHGEDAAELRRLAQALAQREAAA